MKIGLIDVDGHHFLNLAMKGDVKAAQYIQNIQMRAKIMKKK